MRVALVLLVIAVTAQTAFAARTDPAGLTQCLRAYSGRFLNTPADGRHADVAVRTYPLVLARRIQTVTAYVWQRSERGTVHRILLVWPGAHGRAAATAVALRVIRHPHRATPVAVLRSDAGRADTRTQDQACLAPQP